MKTSKYILLAAMIALPVSMTLFGCSESSHEHAKAESDTDSVSNNSIVMSDEAIIWTCSMHPQVQLPEPGECPICGMELIPVGGSGSKDVGERKIELSESAKKIAEIQVTKVRKAKMTYQLRLNGSVEPDETTVRTITAWVPGRIERMYVSFTGATVRKGEPIFEIYSPQLISAQEELIQALEAHDELSTSHLSIVKSSALSNIASAEDRLRLLGMTRSQVEAIKKNRETNEFMLVTSPVTGVVLNKDVKEGQFVKEGQTLLRIADLQTVWVTFDAYEPDLAWINVGQRVKFTTETNPGEEFEGAVDFIDPVVNVHTRTARARVNMENANGKLRPGAYAHGVIYASNAVVEEMIMIPASATLVTGERAVVYVQDPANPHLYEGREITLGPKTNGYYTVIHGLAEGEMVVTNGAFKIDAAMQIQAKPSMMNPSGNSESNPDTQTGSSGAAGSASATGSTSSTAAEMSHSKGCGIITKAFTDAYQTYFDIQASLSKDNLGGAKTAANSFLVALPTETIKCMSKEIAKDFESKLTSLDLAANKISGANDIEVARAQFEPLSLGMIAMASEFGAAGEDTVFQYYCPMAFSGKGASWIQNEKGTANPYYGSAMLRCGGLKNTYANSRDAERNHAHGESNE
ncbi:MAG: efflux RND transporter periplasmic adaptor subunit [candidate division Zixibacteria bacterium]|nr:efflux RND transporter periplasmic adaptor subunit [candidate division Zixibacteria bacterium]